MSAVRATGRNIAASPATLIVWAVLVLLAFLVAYPLLIAAGRVIGDLAASLEALARASASGTLAAVLANTAMVIVLASLLALFVGSLLAWINERSDASLGPIGDILPLAPLLVPPVAGVIGWVVLLDPHVGFVNHVLRAILAPLGITMIRGPFNIYSLGGLVAMTALYMVPFVYLVVSASLRRLDPSLEEASRVAGAGIARTLARVTLPAIAPALAAAALLTIIEGIGMFSVPFIIGTGAKVDVLSVYIFRLLDTYPPQMALALVLAGLMLLVVQVLLILQRVMMPAGRHAAIGGRGLRLGRFELGVWRHPARALAGLFMILTSVLPVIGLAIVSLQPFWTPAIRWQFLSFKNYAFVLFDNALTSRALVMSLLLGVAVATFAMIVVGLIMLHAHQRRGAGLRFADTITNLPATIPHTVIGVSFIIAFAVPPFRLYGTALILFLAYLAMALPAAARAASSAASGIGQELAEASRVFRASEARTFARILFPLALPGLIAGWIIIFIHTAGEVTASSLLGGTGNPVIGRVLMELWSFGSFPQVAALSLIITAVNATLVFAMLRFTRHGFESGR